MTLADNFLFRVRSGLYIRKVSAHSEEKGRDSEDCGCRNRSTSLNMNLPLQGFLSRIINRYIQKGR